MAKVKSVERFDAKVYCGEPAMVAEPNGRYVRYKDYDMLLNAQSGEEPQAKYTDADMKAVELALEVLSAYLAANPNVALLVGKDRMLRIHTKGASWD